MPDSPCRPLPERESGVNRIVAAPEGTAWIAGGSGRLLRVPHDGAPQVVEVSVEGRPRKVGDVALGASGLLWLIVEGADGQPVAGRWSPAKGTWVPQKLPVPPRFLAWSQATGTLFAVGVDTRLYALCKGEASRVREAGVNALSIAAGGDRLLVRDSETDALLVARADRLDAWTRLSPTIKGGVAGELAGFDRDGSPLLVLMSPWVKGSSRPSSALVALGPDGTTRTLAEGSILAAAATEKDLVVVFLGEEGPCVRRILRR